MRDDDGIYVGVHVCRHWHGVDRYEEKECCGGRRYRVAYCVCDVRGKVVAESVCCAACPRRDEDLKKDSRN